MKPSFLARPIPIFGNVAVLTLCMVIFWVPFGLRGARKAIEGMKNDVKDWLPSNFPETRELEWFRDHFLGEQFIIVTWPGATGDSPEFKLLERKLRSEMGPAAPVDNEADDDVDEPPDPSAEEANALAMLEEDRRAAEIGEKYGLHIYGDLKENSHNQQEKWLLGEGERWFYILPNGDLYQWHGRAHVLDVAQRGFKRKVLGDDTLSGDRIATLGKPSDIGSDGKILRANRYWLEPRRVTVSFFSSVVTGPDVLEELAAKDGPLWPRGSATDEAKQVIATELAYERLNGVLFGPQPPPDFDWTSESVPKVISEAKLESLPEDWQTQMDAYIANLIHDQYGGERAKLADAPHLQQMRHYRNMYRALGVEPPSPQTCILVTLSEAGRRDLSRVIGRPVLGKPRGRVLQIASGECDIAPEDLRLGGPPVDNVAIDEEGAITLTRLVSLSALIGVVLAWLCFRSLKITFMIFFIGGVSALASLGIVWWGGSSIDAILLTMPSLVYVLGLSGAVHIVNYYRDAVEAEGVEGAPERAVGHGWFPCTLAAFTTSLGLGSLLASNIIPIQKFGLYSALGVMATLILLFTYLPAALEIWPPGYQKRTSGSRPVSLVTSWIEAFWNRVGLWIVRRHYIVMTICTIVMIAVGLGLFRIQTSVQLLKLFDSESKIIQDYHWLEANLGRLVPMELVLQVDPSVMTESSSDNENDAADDTPVEKESRYLQYDFLERIEMVDRVKGAIEKEFGDDGRQILGNGMAVSTFSPDLPGPNGGGFRNVRTPYNQRLEENRGAFLKSDYLRDDMENGDELLRISLRIGALNDVDYGDFVNDLKQVVEPILSAYRRRTETLRYLVEQNESLTGSVLVIAAPPVEQEGGGEPDDIGIDPAKQTQLFVETFDEILRNRGFRTGSSRNLRLAYLSPAEQGEELNEEEIAEKLASFDVVLLVDETVISPEQAEKHAKHFIDARDHQFDPKSSQTAADLATEEDPNASVTVVYTGIVPIVYKAQRTLLESLINSIGLAFLMIAIVMMILLRDWKRRISIGNVVNLPGGMLSMLPNVFPVIIIFGVMGHAGILVDIGSMMTASVAMGVAVDDTIHFLNWYRLGLREGKTRHQSIALAYKHVATAMTQTTAIGGMGLCVFALSTFTPTQRFGVLMLTLLMTALVGDLIFLPAILASPLGKFFGPKELGGEEAKAAQAAAQGSSTPS